MVLELVHLFSPSRLLRNSYPAREQCGDRGPDHLPGSLRLAAARRVDVAPVPFVDPRHLRFCGALHHGRLAWGIFILPIVLGLVLLAGYGMEGEYSQEAVPEAVRAWAWLHFILLLSGAVGLSVAFVASVMYLVQAYRLRHKAPPGEGVRLLSLERLETMHRRAIGWAFLLFTAGLLIGIALLWNTKQLEWWDPKVVSTLVLWVVFAVLTHLRYLANPQGARSPSGPSSRSD